MLLLRNVYFVGKYDGVSKFMAQIFSTPTRALPLDLVADGGFCASF
jgi:hypothetical protein